MNHPDRNIIPEPDFTKDTFEDMVLHKDDEPVVRDEANEPGPDAFKPMEEWTGHGVNDGNCWFPVHFNYGGQHYTADVQKKMTPFAEYNVSGITPAVDHLPDPFVVAQHFKDAKYDFPVNEDYYPESFGATIVKAIEEGANL